MRKDFETYPIGTIKEIRLSRALAMAIESELQVSHFSEKILNAYKELKAHYDWQIETENDWKVE
jgi:hypothetical protein